MKQVPSADFRKLYTHETEPVAVTAYGKVIGRYYPDGTAPEVSVSDEVVVAAEEVAPRMTIRPTHGPRPVMTTTTKPVLDPLEMRKVERARWTEFQARMYGPKKKD